MSAGQRKLNAIKEILDKEDFNERLNRFVQENPERFNPDGSFKKGFNSKSKFVVDGKKKSIRTNDVQAFMIELSKKNPEFVFRTDTLFPRNQARVQEELLNYVRGQSPSQTETPEETQPDPRLEAALKKQEKELQKYNQEETISSKIRSDDDIMNEFKRFENLLNTNPNLTLEQLNDMRSKVNAFDSEDKNLLNKALSLNEKIIRRIILVRKEPKPEPKNDIDEYFKENLDQVELILNSGDLTKEELDELETILKDTKTKNKELNDKAKRLNEIIEDKKTDLEVPELVDIEEPVPDLIEPTPEMKTTEVQTEEQIPTDLPELVDIEEPVPELIEDKQTQTQTPSTSEMQTQTGMSENELYIPEYSIADLPPAPMNETQGTQTQIPSQIGMGTQTGMPSTSEMGTQAGIAGQPPPVYKAPSSNVLPEPKVYRKYFNKDGIEVDMDDTSIEGRLNQIEYFAGFAEDNLNIPDDIRESGSQVLTTIREAKKANEKSHNIFSKIYNVGKKILKGISSIPLIPEFIKAPAQGVLIGVEAIEQTIKVVSGKSTGTGAIREGVNLAGEIFPEAAEITDAINSGLDVFEYGNDFIQKMRGDAGDEDTKQETHMKLENSNIDRIIIRTENKINVPYTNEPIPEITLGGVQGNNEYYEPIHGDALAIYFKDANFPDWNKELFVGRDKRFSMINEEDYAPYLQQQTAMIWNKYSVDMLIPRLVYQSPNDPSNLIIKENREILQLMNVIVGIRQGADMKRMIAELDQKVAKMIETDDEEHGRQKGNYDRNIKVSLDTKQQNVDGKEYFGKKKSLAEEVMQKGMPDLSDRKIMSYGYSAAGRKFDLSMLKKEQEKVELPKLQIPNFTNESLKLSQISNIRV